MLVTRPEPRILMRVPKWEWREPSLSQCKDQFGNQDRTRFFIRGWKVDGGLVKERWYEDRDEFDFALWQITVSEPYADIWYEFATVSFLTTASASDQHYAVPSDWNSANNLIEVIASGASGGVRCGTNGGAGQVSRASGGGGGAYSAQPNVALTQGGSMTYRLPPGGAGVSATISDTNFNGNNGADAWVNSTTLAGASVGAKGGLAGSAGSTGAATNGGLGGDAASGVGTTKRSGGRGGNLTSTGTSAARASGGGGSGGPSSDGSNGGDSATANVATAGGNGGSPNGGTGSAAADGSASADGGEGTTFQASPARGSGGGSGGSRVSGSAAATSGNGGSYGAGSGGAATRNASGNTGNATSGDGGQALIVITYTPSVLGFFMMF